MSKINPYCQNEEERKQFKSIQSNFSFKDPNSHSKLLMLIAGKEGCGKTHLACTMSEKSPVYLIDTEYRAQIVTRKFKNIKLVTAKKYLELVAAVSHIIDTQPEGTIVLDSGSDLQVFAEIQYLERNKKEKVGMPWNWSEVWFLCNSIIDMIKFSNRFNLVITARLKDEYVNNSSTGKLIPRIYSALPYKSDLVLQYTNDKQPRLEVTKNGFNRNNLNPLQPALSLPKIIEALSNELPKNKFTKVS